MRLSEQLLELVAFLWKQAETLFSFFSLTRQHASIKVICPSAEITDII
jgi:hypothetical protein